MSASPSDQYSHPTTPELEAEVRDLFQEYSVATARSGELLTEMIDFLDEFVASVRAARRVNRDAMADIEKNLDYLLLRDEVNEAQEKEEKVKDE